VSLTRGGAVVATAPVASTNPEGAWEASLTNHSLSDPSDALTVEYTGAGAPSPSSSTYTDVTQLADAAVISESGTNITIDCAVLGVSCDVNVPVTVDYGSGATEVFTATPDIAGNPSAELTPAVSANDRVSFMPTYEYRDGTDLSVSLVAGLPGTGNLDSIGFGPPVCSADLVDEHVVCGNLAAGRIYEVVHTRGPATVERQTLTASGTPLTNEPGSVTGTFPGLNTGDEITVIVPAGSEPARTLTTLQIYALRVDTIDQDAHLDPSATSGACEPGELNPTTDGVCSWVIRRIC
jgi:hypothetical protein